MGASFILSIPDRIVRSAYAVRGELVSLSQDLQAQMDGGQQMPFKKIIPCHIGNPQSVGQPCLTFHRQVLASLICPSLRSQFLSDVQQRAEHYDRDEPLGAYSQSLGRQTLRNEVAAFLGRRDGLRGDPKNIFLTDGASPGIVRVLEFLCSSERDGVMVPIPQYPLYSGTIVRLGGTVVGYYLDEAHQWGLDLEELKTAFTQSECVIRALVVINPGNPTGALLSVTNMKAILQFCEENSLILLADEVYQDNIWVDEPFVSFRKVALDTQSQVPIFSFHSISKGYYGECGLRGGYMEVLNGDPELLKQLVKVFSMALCSNSVGQAMMASVCRPPQQGDPSFPLFAEERAAILGSLSRKAKLATQMLNEIPGYSCQPSQGALYAFPSVDLPEAFQKHALEGGRQPDAQYCRELLETTGILTTPGSGFGQRPGTFHYRLTILPEEAEFREVLQRIQEFHQRFLSRWSN